jgi:DNA-directed RNA polymerase specialized sigma24 family protein
MENMERPSDWDLIEACKKRDGHAWKELVGRHERSVRLSIQEKLGENANDIQLVEDLAQEVLVALIEKGYKRLGLYDPERGCFDTYLKAMGSQIIQRWRCRESARTEHVFPLNEQEPIDPGGDAGLAQAELAEFRRSLTPQESRCLEENLMGAPKQRPDEPPLSDANVRQLKHRLEQKAVKHFDS